ncbi:putative ExsB superfamily protein [Bradyrhizobium sp. ORS 285]|nr:putative ExsB superfamily protein [Bradyrhizobium sp. ORS 285]SMX56134.1 putative ExsB superfamily protein [Bradyrhizobium sp. ORS 285]
MTSALLLSGGMDSTAIAFWKRPAIGVTIDYGQVAAPAELRAAAAVCADLAIRHIPINVDLSPFGSGDMAGRPAIELAPVREWWPFRNQALITIAAMATIGLGVDHLMIGTLRTDGHHSDGTKGFVDRLADLLFQQEGKIRLEAPAIGMDAVELAQVARVPIEILAWSHSCHRSDYACGDCGGCRKHYRTMEALGVAPY